MNRLWVWLAGFITAHHRWIMAVAVVATVGLAFGLPRIHFKTGQDTLISPSSKVYQDNLRYQGTFGGDPVLVLFEGDVHASALRLQRRHASPDFEQELNADPRYFSIVSPLTILQFGVEQAKIQQELALAEITQRQQQAAQEARQSAAARGHRWKLKKRRPRRRWRQWR